eukprot:TRINITY_DN66824_c0_g1_i1.p1 TRINITY_DN66824_c0_g1~~TRINITY_DN66824_c0_g1_i1.p1  ORF type:complete len:207 (-),score=63.06 TRINITY_DN66824_c0_g1_i1:486-1043(-)
MPAGGDNLPRNFSWVVPGKVAGCACPSSERELVCLVGLGVTHLVTLSMDTPPPAAIRGIRGLRSTVIPIKEFRGPRVDELIKFNELVSKELGDRGQVAVHCRMGRGRTGTVLAAYMMAQDGLSALEAIRRVRGARPGSVETRDQEAALELFEKHLGDQKEREREREKEVYFFHLESDLMDDGEIP